MSSTETLAVISPVATSLRIGRKVQSVEGTLFEVQGYLNSLARSKRTNYKSTIVGTVVVAVTIPKMRCTDPDSPWFRRMILDNATADGRLNRAVAREQRRQAV